MKNYILLIACLLLGSTLFGQTSWYEIPTGTDKKLNAIDFPSNNIGYIVGEDTTILKTTDGGQTWTQLGLNGIIVTGLNAHFTDIEFIDENTGFLVSGYSGVYKTVDGAQTWTQVQYSMCFPHTTYLFDETNYIVAGGDCFEGAKLEKVVNGVGSPANLSMNFWNSNEVVVEMSFINANVGLAATRSSYMLRTIDGGSNWDTISVNLNVNAYLTSVLMVNDTLCYAGYNENGGGFAILKSVDGGLTWGQDMGTATFFYPAYLSVHAANNGDIYSGALPTSSSGGMIFETVDGLTWDYQQVDQAINAMTSYGSDITFGVGDSGYLVVNTPISNLGISETVDLSFNLYPNPVQNELTIENPNAETMEVSVLDANGRILKMDSLPSGSSKIDCSDLDYGMYFIQVKVNGRIGMKQFVKLH